MDIVFLAHFFNGILMVAIPVGVALFLTRRWKMGARIWWIGAATFILSQVGHIPFNLSIGKVLNQTGMVAWNPIYQMIFNAVFLGLSAGVFEEVARYLVLRWWARDARSWRKGVLFGAGHGGAEAIIFGGLALYTFFQLAALRNSDLTAVVPADQLALAQNQVASYWSTTWYASLFGALERFFSIPAQISFAVIVMQVFIRKHIRWLFIAIGYHALLDGVVVVSSYYLGVYSTEAIICGFSILSVILIFRFKQPDPVVEILTDRPVPNTSIPEPDDENSENLEKTRYQ